MKTKIFISLILLINFMYAEGQDVPYPDKIYGGSENGIVGSITDEFDVTPTGQFAYRVPINIPGGTAGMTPSLSIVYNSTPKNGLLGIGFDLAGLSMINRAPANIHKDGKAGFVNFSSTDKFMLDGQRLCLIKTVNGENEYRCETNPTSKIVAHGNDMDNPTGFTLYAKSGHTYEYTANTGNLTRSASDVLFWLLTKVSDIKGNYYTISYDRDDANGEYWPVRIDYTGNTNTNLAPYASVRFSYQGNPYKEISYIYGKKVQKSKLISYISIYSGEKRIKYYKTGYKMQNYAYLLDKITEYDGNGNKLNPTKFTWYHSNDYVTQQASYNTNSNISKANLHIGDFNADGKADFLVIPKSDADWSGWRLFLSTGTDFSFHSSGDLEESSDPVEVIVGDFNGDGYSDFVVKGKYDKRYISFLYLASIINGRVSFKLDKSIVNDTRNYSMRTAEFNGDGMADMFVYFHNSDKGKLISSGKAGNSPYPLCAYFDVTCSEKFDRIELADFNGDGLTDIMNLCENNYYLFESNGSGSVAAEAKGYLFNKHHHLYIGDFNCDGKSDIFLTGSDKDPNSGGWSNWQINFSKGNGFVTETISKHFNSKEKIIYVADLNGDGKDDFYAVDKVSAENNRLSMVYAYINNGQGSSFTKVDGDRTYGLDKWKYYLGDFNGDGRCDFLCTANFSNVNWTGCQLYVVPGGIDRLLSTIEDGLGNKTEIYYKRMNDGDIHTPGTTRNYPLTSFIAGFYLVDKVVTPDGNGGKRTVSYKYENALLHRTGRGMLGFEKFKIYDETNKIETRMQYEVDRTEYVIALKQTETLINNKRVSLNTFTNKLNYVFTNSGNKVFTFDVYSSVEKKYEINTGDCYSTLEMSNKYDSYGNVIESVSKIGNETTTNTNTFTNDEAKWQIGRLTGVTVTKTKNNESVIRKTSYTYKNDGLLEIEKIEPANQLLGYTVTYEHDDYGNVTGTITTPNDSRYKPRTSKYKYDDKGRAEVESWKESNGQRFFTNKRVIDNDLGLTSYVLDPNNVKTSYTYDGFGQLLETKTPIETNTTLKRWSQGHADAPGNSVYFTYTEVTGTPPVLEFFDSLGRTVRTVTQGFNSNEIIYVDVIYNSKGHLEKTSEPYFKGQAVYYSKNEYDDAGRIIRQYLPDNAYYEFTYSGLTTTIINPKNQKETRTLDNFGRLIETKDDNDVSVQYVYNAAGNCVKVTGPRTTIVTEYDIMGNRIKLIDPDLGTIRYVYNAFGELISQQDDVGTVTNTYDDFGRLIREDVSDGAIEYLYDTKRIGFLSSKAYNQNSTEIFYDEYGRTQKVVNRINDIDFPIETLYDDKNRVSEIIYPTRFTVCNEYNSNGYLSKVKRKDGRMIWQADKVNARGQLEQFTYGNGVSTTIGYDPQKGILKSIYAPGIQNWNYEYDAIGNLTSRKDKSRYLDEYFYYDNLNRLSTVFHSAGLYTLITYDNAGNIKSKSHCANNLNYYDNSNRLKSIQANNDYSPFTWDNISYNSFNKVSSIKVDNNLMKISYGPDRERVYTSFTDGYEKKERYHVGSLYEYELYDKYATRTHYIFADCGVVAKYVELVARRDVPNSRGLDMGIMSYIHKDNLGSIQAISDSSGKLSEEFSYDPWGLRRDPDTWFTKFDYPMLAYDLTLPMQRGFTGHEHYDIFGMVNMNGRIYDPVLGRFLSPDPYIQAPDFTQGLNRYSYCMNNPLSYVDPSGYSWFSRHWKSLIAGITGIVAAALPGGQGFSAALISGAVGGLATGVASAILNGANAFELIKAGIGGALSGFIGGVAGKIAGRVVSNSFSSAKTTWNAIKLGAANLVLSEITPTIPIMKGSNWAVSVSPVALFTSFMPVEGGKSKISARLGGSISYTKKLGDFTFNCGIDAVGESQADGKWTGGIGNTFGGLGYDDGELGVSMHFTRYHQGNKQLTGVLGIRTGDLKFNLENDWFSRLVGMGTHDRWRSSAIEVQYKSLVLGVNVYTNEVVDKVLSDLPSPTGNPYGVYDNGYQESSPMYIGFKSGAGVMRFGYNRSGTDDGGFYGQNWWHGFFPGFKTPDFKYGNYNDAYMQIGTYKPYSFY